jgi:ferredoxin
MHILFQWNKLCISIFIIYFLKDISMAVKITSLCINCGSCIDECPSMAIVSTDDAPVNTDVTYVKPEKCIECEDSDPRCASSCPTEGAIVWDLPTLPNITTIM